MAFVIHIKFKITCSRLENDTFASLVIRWQQWHRLRASAAPEPNLVQTTAQSSSVASGCCSSTPTRCHSYGGVHETLC